MLIYTVFVVAGLAGLYYGTERFIDGTVASGHHLKLSDIVVGMVLLSAATSFPEIVTSAAAALHGHPDLGIGNAVGSNITNILLVTGVMLLLAKGSIRGKVNITAFSILLAVSVVSFMVVANHQASRVEGLLLLAGFPAFLLSMYLFPGRFVSSNENTGSADISLVMAVVLLLLGLLIIFASVEALLYGAVNIAERLGISDLVIGLTIVAIGTSLPELAATVSCARRGRPELAIGTIVGSNILNLLGVMGLCMAIHPTTTPTLLLWRDLPVMLAATLLLIWFTWKPGGRQMRIYGAILLAGFIAYQLLLYFSER